LLKNISNCLIRIQFGTLFTTLILHFACTVLKGTEFLQTLVTAGHVK
jgi:hypothetical protein